MSNIMLNQNQQRVLEILVKTQAGQICKTRSSEILGVSVRQLNRKLKALRENGAASVIHGNTGKSNVGRLDQSISAEIVRLYTSEYRDWNFSHFRDVLVDKYHLDICLSSVRRILENHGIKSPQAHKRKAKSHPPRPRRENAGELIQIDACDHAWLYGVDEKFSLHGGIDDATGTLVG